MKCSKKFRGVYFSIIKKKKKKASIKRDQSSEKEIAIAFRLDE